MTGLGYGIAADVIREECTPANEAVRFLLHALNQPLTGLQCILELSASRSARPEEHIGTLRDALELTSRVRLMVEALQEVVYMDEARAREARTTFPFGALLRDSLADLLPVAESKRIRMQVLGNIEYLVHADRGLFSSALFRLLESALTFTPEGDDLKILGIPEGRTICLIVSCRCIHPPVSTKVNRQRVGLLVAQHAFQLAGASCRQEQQVQRWRCNVRVPLACEMADQTSEVRK